MVRSVLLAAILICGCTAALAQATGGPDVIDYQGVLRDAMGNPLNGSFDMVFRFVDVEDGVVTFDERVAANGNPVDVVGGLFRVAIGQTDEEGGGGTVDGPGPGNYSNLRWVFRDYSSIHLEIEVNGEVLSPTIPVNSSGYALNTKYFNGLHSSQFLRSDATDTAQARVGFTAVPTGSGIADAPIFVNPANADPEATLLGVAVGGDEQLKLDASGTLQGKSAEFNGDCTTELPPDLEFATYGVIGRASGSGGRFSGCTETSVATLGSDSGTAVMGVSLDTGGFFSGSLTGLFAVGHIGANIKQPNPAASEAWIARSGVGIEAVGNSRGGIFRDNDGSGLAELATGDIGVNGSGDQMGGFFEDTNSSGLALIAVSDRGIEAFGDEFGVRASGGAGGYFETNLSSNYAYIATGNYGVSGYGLLAGVRGQDLDAGTRSWLASDTATVAGTGTKDFLQNHPYDPTRVIAYSAPEGDEVATYTRGSARLTNGEARVVLGETFQWVTNPDFGLTAHLTPRGVSSSLYVESLSTRELVVRSEDRTGASRFDYIVYGLRIGFEDVPVLREKEEEAQIPSMAEHRELLSRQPELRATTARERFRRMRELSGEPRELDLSASDELVRAIVEFDPAVHGIVEANDSHDSFRAGLLKADTDPHEDSNRGADSVRRRVDSLSPALVDRASSARGSHRSNAGGPVALVPVSGTVEIGDVLVIDPESPGAMRVAQDTSDSTVVGIVTGVDQPSPSKRRVVTDRRNDTDNPQRRDALQHVLLATSGITYCKVDAGYGEIRPGDLLVTSPSPGMAMRGHNPQTGTILGKALEPLDSGTGQIRVLVMLR